MLMTPQDELRFRFKIGAERADGCWPWEAALTGPGYGAFRINGQTCYAHRIAYELFIGPIPEGLSLDHLCRNPACVNPAHLEPVTHKENLARGNHANGSTGQTHCKRGHPFDEENTYRYKGARACRACMRLRAKRKA